MIHNMLWTTMAARSKSRLVWPAGTKRARSWYAGSYPELTKFVRTELPKAADNAKTFSAFIRYAEYTRWGGATVFWPTAKPSIEIENLNKDPDREYYILAKYKTEFTGKIFVDEEWAKRFEKDHQLAHAKLLMEACILHEMCHRGDWDDGVEQANEPRRGLRDRRLWRGAEALLVVPSGSSACAEKGSVPFYRKRPTAVFDFKFTINPNPTLSPRRISQIRAGAGLGPSVPITVVHP